MGDAPHLPGGTRPDTTHDRLRDSRCGAGQLRPTHTTIRASQPDSTREIPALRKGEPDLRTVLRNPEQETTSRRLLLHFLKKVPEASRHRDVRAARLIG